MVKSLHSFTLDDDVSSNLFNVDNKSKLVNDLLKTYFGSADYTSNALERTEAKMKLLKEQFEKEQAQAHKIILEVKRQEEEQAQTQKDKEEEEVRRKKNIEYEKVRREQNIALLKEKLGFEPSPVQIVGYLSMLDTEDYEKANQFLELWIKEHANIVQQNKH